MMLSGTVLLWSRQYREVKNFKYERCKAIERELGMKQHVLLPYSPGKQTRWHAYLMVAFLAAWLILFALVLAERNSSALMHRARHASAPTSPQHLPAHAYRR